MTEAKGGARPNFLTIVLDCVRASDFVGPNGGNPALPIVSKLRKSSIVFPRAAATAPWTIPSHASLFTGLYPWETGVHMPNPLRLEANVPTVAQMLTREGYATFSASANGFICPEIGLVNGFESSTWGDWWERYFRLPARELPPRAANFGPTQHLPDGPGWAALEEKAWYFHRFPVVFDIINRLTGQIRFAGNPRRVAVSPWIEETVKRWLAAQPASTPTHCFVNFLDAHEPYLTDPQIVHGLREWHRLTKVRVDRSNILAGHWVPTAEEFAALHELYVAMVHFLDRRIGRLIEIYRELGRWDNTVLILTSDHGQAFGEHGHLFHGQRLWEPLLRIPLLLRIPGRDREETAEGWASLVDIAPTVLELAGADPTGRFPNAYPLTQMIHAPRPAPAMAMADGIHHMMMVKTIASPERIADWDRKWIAAYQDDVKLLYDATRGEFHAYDLANDPGEANDVYRADSPVYAGLERPVREAAARLVGGPSSSEPEDVTDRLRSWGYL
jgi:arylsulfatase A-like enzyme